MPYFHAKTTRLVEALLEHNCRVHQIAVLGAPWPNPQYNPNSEFPVLKMNPKRIKGLAAIVLTNPGNFDLVAIVTSTVVNLGTTIRQVKRPPTIEYTRDYSLVAQVAAEYFLTCWTTFRTPNHGSTEHQYLVGSTLSMVVGAQDTVSRLVHYHMTNWLI
ncbi:MAG: hypothetical protein ABIG95_00630 [Candidatus Woesearchaeota archaeon]